APVEERGEVRELADQLPLDRVARPLVEQDRELVLAQQTRHLARGGKRARDQRRDGVLGGAYGFTAARHQVTVAVDQQRAARLRELQEGVDLCVQTLDVVLVEDET